MITNFIFNDIVLYSKGWYKSHGDILDDLGYLFSKIYAWTPKTEGEISGFMMRVLDKLYEEKKVTFKAGSYMMCFTSFFDEVKRDMNLYGWSFDRAVIQVVLNVLSQLKRDEIKINPPHYGKKEHFRMGMLIGEWPASMTYAEMNRRAQKEFKED